jgi:cysteine dioxygenase
LPQGVAELALAAARESTQEGLRDVLGAIPKSLLSLTHAAAFAEDGQGRRVLFQDEHVALVLNGWLPGQGSEVHDHPGALGAYRVLRGVATECRFEVDSQGYAIEIGSDDFLPGSVLGSEGTEIHALRNDAAASEPLVTLHVYRPPTGLRIYPVRRGGAS